MPFQSSYPINTGSYQRPISPGGGGIPYNGIRWDGASRKEYFLRLQVYEKKGVGISLVEQYERVGKSVISVGRKTQKNSHEFYGGEKVDESLLVL